MSDRIGDLAAELVDQAMLAVHASLGDGPVSYKAELQAQQAARKLVHAAVEAALGRYEQGAADRAVLEG